MTVSMLPRFTLLRLQVPVFASSAEDFLPEDEVRLKPDKFGWELVATVSRGF